MRLTNKWTDTLDEAFGASGKKGRLGEEYAMKVFDSWGWETRRNESCYKSQVQGKDIEYKPSDKWLSCDIKSNMRDDGVFYVYADWLFKVECDHIYHVNPNKGTIAGYSVKIMRDFYNRIGAHKALRERISFNFYDNDDLALPKFIHTIKVKI